MTIEEMIRTKAELGYSLKKISEGSGIPVVTLQKIFAGKTEHPRRNTLNAIEKVFLVNGEKGREKEGLLQVERNRKAAGENTERMLDREEKKPGDYSVEDYDSLPYHQGAELLDGVLYEMHKPEMIHQDIISYIHMCFFEYVREKGGFRVYESGTHVRLNCDEKTLVKPDLFVLGDKKKIHGSEVCGAPDFILEVLSRETRKRDMSVKLHLYMNAGVREYWMLDPDHRKLVIYNFMEEDFLPSIYSLEGSVPVAVFQGQLEIDMAPVAEILQEREKAGQDM